MHDDDLYIPSGLTIIQNGRIRQSNHIQAVDHFIDLVSKKPMWDVIERLVNVFSEMYPKEIGQFAHRELNMKNEFGADENMNTRFIGTLPERLYDAINFLYPEELQKNNKEFMLEFFKRYPAFRVARKL